jgi:hypothetical protein
MELAAGVYGNWNTEENELTVTEPKTHVIHKNEPIVLKSKQYFKQQNKEHERKIKEGILDIGEIELFDWLNTPFSTCIKPYFFMGSHIEWMTTIYLYKYLTKLNNRNCNFNMNMNLLEPDNLKKFSVGDNYINFVLGTINVSELGRKHFKILYKGIDFKYISTMLKTCEWKNDVYV